MNCADEVPGARCLISGPFSTVVLGTERSRRHWRGEAWKSANGKGGDVVEKSATCTLFGKLGGSKVWDQEAEKRSSVEKAAS